MKKAFLSIIYMFALTLVFTSMVTAVKYVNSDRVERNQAVKLQRIVLKVLDIDSEKPMTDSEVDRLFSERIKPVQAGGRMVYICYGEKDERISGYAFPVGGPGFWGPIDGMVGVGPNAGEILGISFYRHSETPGLGGRISENWFAEQFHGLPLHPVEGDENIFYLVPAGTGRSANQLDAVTGATGTSRAVEAFLNRELDDFLKETWGRLQSKDSGS